RSANDRPVRRARIQAAVRAVAESLVELGHGNDEPLPRDRPGPVADARQQSGRTVATDSYRPARRAGVPAGAAQPNQLRVSPDAGIPALEAHMGRAACRRALGTTGGVFLRRVRAARIAADLLWRVGYP